eukprot:9448791-Pyramimonas_sp.AAC.1
MPTELASQSSQCRGASAEKLAGLCRVEAEAERQAEAECKAGAAGDADNGNKQGVQKVAGDVALDPLLRAEMEARMKRACPSFTPEMLRAEAAARLKADMHSSEAS